jgi:DNA-binding NtrC family response regulator
MKKKNIVIFEKYDGVRFVLERSLEKYKGNLNIYSSHWKSEIKNHIEHKKVDLLITELSKYNPDGLEISRFAREISPDLQIFWITVLGCDVFREQIETLGNIRCIEKPLEIQKLRNKVLQALDS